MTATALLHQVRRRGCELMVTPDGRLMSRWPNKKPDPVLASALAQHRDAVIKAMAEEEPRKAALRAELEADGSWIHPQATRADLVALADMKNARVENVVEGRWVHRDYLETIAQRAKERAAINGSFPSDV